MPLGNGTTFVNDYRSMIKQFQNLSPKPLMYLTIFRMKISFNFFVSYVVIPSGLTHGPKDPNGVPPYGMNKDVTNRVFPVHIGIK